MRDYAAWSEAPGGASRRPRIVVSAGDPAGVGPELTVAALGDPALARLADFVVTGDAERLRALADATGIETAARFVCAGPTEPVEPGVLSAASGRAAVASVRAAVELLRAQEGDVLVTAPIAKRALALAGHPWPGQTEMLADLCGRDDLRVMLVSDPLTVVHVTTHLSLSQAIAGITCAAVLRTIELADEAARRRGCERPRIGVAGLNPHAGEGGLLGDEEAREIAPAVAAARSRGLDADGPRSADTLIPEAAAGAYDVVVAMYHDQGHIPVKLLAGDRAVAVTLGLPFVRTAPDHGAAPALAGTGRVRTESFVAAVRLAATLAPRRAVRA